MGWPVFYSISTIYFSSLYSHWIITILLLYARTFCVYVTNFLTLSPPSLLCEYFRIVFPIFSSYRLRIKMREHRKLYEKEKGKLFEKQLFMLKFKRWAFICVAYTNKYIIRVCHVCMVKIFTTNLLFYF